MGEFINLKQGNMSVEQCVMKFTLLFKYAPSMVQTTRDMVAKESHKTIFYNNMYISRSWCMYNK